MKKLIFSLFAIALSLNVVSAQSVAFKVPAYQKFQLNNGLTIYLMEQREVPVISVSAIIPAGAIYDADRSGLASLTAAALQHGTKSYTKSFIEEELDFVGASLNTYASKEFAGLSAKFASRDTEKVLPILKELLADPVFNPEEFEKERKRVIVQLEQDKESPRFVIGSYWDRFIFGDHPYGNPISGSPATLAKFTAEDARTFYQQNYSPQGSAIAIVGDFDVKRLKPQIEKLFSNWRRAGSRQAPLTPKVSVPADGRVLLVNKEDARETTFLIGGVGIQRNNPDFVAVDVINTVLGGRFTSWLNDALRVNSGLTYGANSRFSPLKSSGTFAISTFTATKTTKAAIDMALGVLDSLHRNGINAETLTSAKNYVKGQFPPRYETASQLAGLLTQMFWYGFDESYINNFQKNVDELNAETARQIIAKYFPRENLQLVLIGKSAEIRDIARSYGTLTEKEITADGF